jgi:hypothetical protein
MKKRYIFGIVMTALLAIAVIAFFVYKNWGDIQDAFSGTKNTPKTQAGVVKAVFTVQASPDPVKPDEIIQQAKSDSKLATELAALKSKTKELTDKPNEMFDKVADTFKSEAGVKASQGAPISQIVVENTKQRQAKDETAAADEYRDILKQIEVEKAKGAIALTGARTEAQKAAKFDAIAIDALDAEMELYAENKIKIRQPRRPLSKAEAEAYVSLCS